MDNSNLELFKQAINEGLSNKIDSITNSCSEEIVYSEKHKIAMRTIVHGKIGRKSATSLKVRRIIAILVAAALLLTSCGIIFRNEIREIFEEYFVKLNYEGDEESNKNIQEIYTLNYVPDGYVLEKENIEALRISYIFLNETGDMLCFEQHALTRSEYYIDSESGYSQIQEIEDYEIYYRLDNNYHSYVWSDEKYFMKMIANVELSNEELVVILNGVSIK